MLNIAFTHCKCALCTNMLLYYLFSGIVPDDIKIAKVCYVYKNGDKNVISNYRPISVLPSFSKVFEKLVCNRLRDYSQTSLGRPPLARQTRVSPWHGLGRISCHAFYPDKPPPSPLATT